MMNIELAEIKHLIQTEDMDIWNYKDELTALIDEAIDRQTIKSEEVADAMPVVRCKECRYYDTTGYPALNPGTGWCDKMDRGVHDDFYCSYRKRRK